MKRPWPLALLLAAGLSFPGSLLAHGVEVYDISGSADKPVATVHFTYSTGEPMAFTKVKVYPPAHPDQEILLSLTDRNGLFSFTPDEPGEWRLEAADDMGHQGSITLQSSAREAQTPEKKADGKAPLPLRMVLGLSLILNIFAVYSFILKGFTKKGTKQEVSHAYQ